MDRPFVICHMVSSVDGKIGGSWFDFPEVIQPLTESNTIRMNYNCSPIPRRQSHCLYTSEAKELPDNAVWLRYQPRNII